MELSGTQDFLNKLASFEWDFSAIWQWLFDTILYWADSFGWMTYVVIVLVIIFIGLSLDLTHHMTSLIVAGAVKGVIYAFLTVVLGGVALLMKVTGSALLASARNSLEFTRNRFSFAKVASESEE